MTRHIVRSLPEYLAFYETATGSTGHAQIARPSRYPCVVVCDEYEDYHSRTHYDLSVAYPPKRQSPAAHRSWLRGCTADMDPLDGPFHS